MNDLKWLKGNISLGLKENPSSDGVDWNSISQSIYQMTASVSLE